MTIFCAVDVALPAEVNDEEEVEAKQRQASVHNRACIVGFLLFCLVFWKRGKGWPSGGLSGRC